MFISKDDKKLIDRLSEIEKINGVSLYNLGVEGESSVTGIADILCEEMGLKGVKYHYTGGEGGWKGDVPRFRYCIDKIHREGWKAEYTSDEAVRKTIQNVLNMQ